MKRGELWLAVWPNDPSLKSRPILIVGNNHRNLAKNLGDIVVVKVTSLERADGSKKPTLTAEDVIMKLKKESIIRCAQIYALEKACLIRQLSQLSVNDMAKVDICLKNVLDLH